MFVQFTNVRGVFLKDFHTHVAAVESECSVLSLTLNDLAVNNDTKIALKFSLLFLLCFYYS